MRTTNEKGWETLPGETGSLCTSECRVFFISILVLSRFKCYSMCLGCVPFISVLSRFAVSSRRLNTWSKTHLSISKIKSFCAPSAVPFSTFVQNSICSFENCKVQPRSCENSKTRTYLKLYRFQSTKQKKRGKMLGI